MYTMYWDSIYVLLPLVEKIVNKYQRVDWNLLKFWMGFVSFVNMFQSVSSKLLIKSCIFCNWATYISSFIFPQTCFDLQTNSEVDDKCKFSTSPVQYCSSTFINVSSTRVLESAVTGMYFLICSRLLYECKKFLMSTPRSIYSQNITTVQNIWIVLLLLVYSFIGSAA